MESKDIIMPVVALVAGMISLYVDPKRTGLRWLLIASLGATTVFSVWFNLQDSQRSARIQQADADERARLNARLSEALQNVNLSLQVNTERLLFLCHTFGNTQCSQSVEADKARLVLIQKLEGRAQSPIRVQYFPKDVDGSVISRALAQVGMQIEERTPVLPHPTNAIWVGDAVTLPEAKFTALTLVRAGVTIRTIRRLKNGGGPRARLIQVGSSVDAVRLPAMTVHDIEDLMELAPAMNDSLVQP
jgi:hypothetical protein